MAFDDVAKSLGLSEEAVNSIPEELRTDKSLEPIKDFGGLLKSYSDGQKFIGGSVRIPKDDAKPEEVAEFENKVLTRLGRPEKAADYKLDLPYPEFINWNKEKIAAYAERMHKAGVTGKGLQEAINWYAEDVAQTMKGQKESFDLAVSQLKADWGAAFDQNIALAKRVRDMYGGEAAKEFFKDDPLGNNPVLIRMLAKIGADLAEGEFLGGPGSDGGMTPEEAKAKINEVLSNKEDIYHINFAGKPGHEERVKEVQGWYQIAYGRI